MVNRTGTGWIVTLFNPAGQNKPQQGITPTDYRENRTVTIRTIATDRIGIGLACAGGRDGDQGWRVEADGAGGERAGGGVAGEIGTMEIPWVG